MVTRTSITDLLGLTINQFVRVYVSIVNVLEKKRGQG